MRTLSLSFHLSQHSGDNVEVFAVRFMGGRARTGRPLSGRLVYGRRPAMPQANLRKFGPLAADCSDDTSLCTANSSAKSSIGRSMSRETLNF
jgi:hypothetical protein